ncbi:MAG: hypothetical protein IKZ82_10875 [Clostridia bacterium]|nr:hypothetical protein [Clostridia bacterium]
MASLMDLLLGADAVKIKERPSAVMRVPRLEELLGGPFELKLEALTSREIDELPSDDRPVHVILKGVKNIDFGNQELANKLKPEGRNTPLMPDEVVRTLFIPGEVNGIATAIFDLSGFGANTIERIEKN